MSLDRRLKHLEAQFSEKLDPAPADDARARVLAKLAEMRARLEQTNPELIARVAAQTPDERRQMVAEIRADLALHGIGRTR